MYVGTAVLVPARRPLFHLVEGDANDIISKVSKYGPKRLIVDPRTDMKTETVRGTLDSYGIPSGSSCNFEDHYKVKRPIHVLQTR